MLNTTVTNLRKNLYEFIEKTVTTQEPITVSTKNGNAVIISEGDYHDFLNILQEYANAIEMQELLKLSRTDETELIDEKDMKW